MPVEILGLNEAPAAGSKFSMIKDAKEAQRYIKESKRKEKKNLNKVFSLEEMLLANTASSSKINANFIVKADTSGTLEAIKSTIEALNENNETTNIKIIHSAMSIITESDIELAKSCNAIVLGFHVRADSKAKALSERMNVEIRYYKIIYNLIEDIENIILGNEEVQKKEVILGNAEVREVFKSDRFGQIAGCMVIDGTMHRNKPIRVLREHKVIFEGELESLKRFAKNVSEVGKTMECGIGVKNYEDIQAGDIIEVYEG
jgi:translation initiation factor IF-2